MFIKLEYQSNIKMGHTYTKILFVTYLTFRFNHGPGYHFIDVETFGKIWSFMYSIMTQYIFYYAQLCYNSKIMHIPCAIQHILKVALFYTQ